MSTHNNTGYVPRIALTPGEPAGIGPDLVVGLANTAFAAEIIVIADRDLLAERARILRLPYTINTCADLGISRSYGLRVLHVPVNAKACPGALNPANADYVLRTLEVGCAGCLDGTFDALVTGPVHKEIINRAGYAFTGHTEWLALRCNSIPVMLLVTSGLRVALVTTHLPLTQVSFAITPQRLELVIRILCQDLLRYFGIAKPKILVCGLNPHAGEGGLLGREEQDIIEPTLMRLRTEGLDLVGPLPADTIFTHHRLEHADAVLAMYHDQGLPVLKYIGFGCAANITLGLPIIRVSVDHGTGLDIAGTGLAKAGSLNYAIGMALRLCNNRLQTQ